MNAHTKYYMSWAMFAYATGLMLHDSCTGHAVLAAMWATVAMLQASIADEVSK